VPYGADALKEQQEYKAKKAANKAAKKSAKKAEKTLEKKRREAENKEEKKEKDVGALGVCGVGARLPLAPGPFSSFSLLVCYTHSPSSSSST
jgi:hypothetical protein